MRIFLLICLGQFVSLFGSKLSEFALGFWILQKTYEQTGSITQFALTILFIYLPNVIISPLAGVLIDRWNRRWAMILSDSVSATANLGMLLLVFSNRLEVWHIYLAVVISSFADAFQLPAYTAAIAQLVPKQNQSRANGMVQASNATARIIAPLMAGFLMKAIHLKGVLLIDLITFIFALATLSSVRFPDLEKSKSIKTKSMNQLFEEIVSGWNYISVRPGLLRLLSFVAIGNFTLGMLEVVLWPLLYQPDSPAELGQVLSIGGCGMLIGSVLISVWGGPKRRVDAILKFVFFQGAIAVLAGFRVSLVVFAFGIFGYLFSQPIIISSNQAIWQSKVPQKLQGRVFSLQQTLERSLAIFAYLIAGPLVDNVLNPLMTRNGALSQTIGKLIGVGTGRGIGLLLILVGLVNIFAAAIAYREPRLRRLEKELPDVGESNLNLSSIRFKA